MYEAIQSMTQNQWLITIFCCIAVCISQWLLTQLLELFRHTNRLHEIFFDPDICRPIYTLEVVDIDEDIPLGTCSLATINYLMMIGRDILLYGDLTPPHFKNPISFNGLVPLRLWIITLKNMNVPAAWDLLEQLEDYGINTDIPTVPGKTVYLDTETTGLHPPISSDPQPDFRWLSGTDMFPPSN